jgi:hypothetical protein
MIIDNGNYPLIAYFLPDKDKPKERIIFKARYLSEESHFFIVNAEGLIDSGIELSLATPKKIKYIPSKSGLIFEGARYSVSGVFRFVPDKTRENPFKRDFTMEYVIVAK